MGGDRAGNTYLAWRERKMRDPEFRAAYDALVQDDVDIELDVRLPRMPNSRRTLRGCRIVHGVRDSEDVQAEFDAWDAASDEAWREVEDDSG